MSKTTHPRRGGQKPGFTLIEIIMTLVIGLFLCVMSLELSHVLTTAPDTVNAVDLQYETIREMEKLIGEYRKDIDAQTLSLGTLLSGWTPADDVQLDDETISVSSTDGTVTFTNVHKVRLSKEDQSITAYFTQ